MVPTKAEVLVVDNRHATIKRYDKRSGRYLGSKPTEGPITSAVTVGERVYFGGANTRRHAGLIVWRPSNNSVGHDSAGYPTSYLHSGPLPMVFNGVALDAWADTLVIAYAATNDILVADTGGKPLEIITIPPRARHGLMPDFGKQAAKLSFPEVFASHSALMDVHHMADGTIAGAF